MKINIEVIAIFVVDPVVFLLNNEKIYHSTQKKKICTLNTGQYVNCFKTEILWKIHIWYMIQVHVFLEILQVYQRWVYNFCEEMNSKLYTGLELIFLPKTNISVENNNFWLFLIPKWRLHLEINIEVMTIIVVVKFYFC